jgi:hypothetical protein
MIGWSCVIRSSASVLTLPSPNGPNVGRYCRLCGTAEVIEALIRESEYLGVYIDARFAILLLMQSAAMSNFLVI